MILSLDVPIWNCLPDDPACSFIGFVTSKPNWKPAQQTDRFSKLHRAASAFKGFVKSDTQRKLVLQPVDGSGFYHKSFLSFWMTLVTTLCWSFLTGLGVKVRTRFLGGYGEGDGEELELVN
jgi:hypothetical protein